MFKSCLASPRLIRLGGKAQLHVNRFSFWLGRPVARGWLIVALVCFLLGLVLQTIGRTQTSDVVHRVSILTQQNRDLSQHIAHDEAIGCKIQQQGLPIGHDLAKILGDIHVVLTVPESAAQKRLAAQIVPPEQLVRQKQAVQNLNDELTVYQKDEAQQPQSRKCAF